MVETFLGIQIIAVCFAGFMLYVAFLHFKRTNISRLEFLTWLTIWIVFIFFTLFPHILNPILATLFIARAMDLIMIMAFMVLTIIGFFNHLSLQKLKKELSEFIRRDALKNAKKT